MADAPAPYLWIDDRGAATQSVALSLERYFGYARPDFDLVRYAVKACGFAVLERSDRGVVAWVNLQSGQTAARTAAARLARSDRPVRLEYWLHGWRSECTSASDAPSRIVQMIEEALRIAERGPYRSSPLTTSDSSLFQHAVAAHRIAMGELGETGMRVLARRGLLERTLVVGRDAGGTLVYRYIGWGFTHSGPDWPFQGLGQPTFAHHDRLYGDHVTRDYVEADGFTSPMVHEVEAEIREPGGATRRSHYERVILPWRGPMGQRLFSVTSRLLPAAQEATARAG